MPHLTLNGTDPNDALETEWLLTNGLGGFAMGTALGTNTRRYHGLLIGSRTPPVHRVVLLHSLIDQLLAGDTVVELSTQSFGTPPRLHPAGWRLLTSFDTEPATHVRWTWTYGDITIRRTLTLATGRSAARIEYEVDSPTTPCRLRIRPLTPLRDFHELAFEDDTPPHVEPVERGIRVHRADVGMIMETDRPVAWTDDVEWWRDAHYARDHARGQGSRESLFSAGAWTVDASAGETTRLALTAALDPPGPVETESADRWEPAGLTRPAGATEARLHRAAGQFIVRRFGGDAWTTSIIAGYPWFADWGRDAMISLPGLLLATGRLEEARSVLLTFARHMRRGIVPNRFDDAASSPHYNTVDASLWYVNAVHAYSSEAAVPPPEQLVDACRSIVAAYRAGTDGPIACQTDGLIVAGSDSTQLTWMDAMRDGVVFTPRHGKPVEINGLWHNALCCLADLTADADEEAELRELAGRTAIAFQMAYWWPERACCHDVMVLRGSDWVGDARLRPNQVIAAALPFSPMTDRQRTDVVETARERLLTPYGLRTLDPEDPDYRGRFEGDLNRRDAAYHQGTVWPWLIGPYCEAVLRAGDFSTAAVGDAERAIEPLLAELDHGCMNQLAEVYDGDAPHRAAGCPAQAWSVAEVLRVMHLIRKGPAGTRGRTAGRASSSP